KVASGGIPKSPIFMATLWFHGIDSSGDTLISVDMYHQGGSDFGQGAMPPGAGIGFQPKVDQVIYKVSRDDIDKGRIDPNQLTNDIINWPAFYEYNGDTLPLAPFVDKNQDGKYNPELGDYPFVRGDQSLFFVYHDMVNHAISQSKPLGLQIQVEAYAFATNDKLNDYVFVRYKIISQNQDLSHFRVGVMSDYDLGNYSDDFVGTDTSLNMTYVLNGDDDDEGILGYGLNPPAFATVFLNQPLCGSCLNQNSWSGDFRIANSYTDYRNLLYGLETDGDSMRVNTPSTPAGKNSRYHFTGNPVNAAGWNMENDNRFVKGDYRMLGITGQDSLMRGDTFDLWLLFAYARGNSGGAKGSLAKLQTDIDDIFLRYFDKPQIPADCFAPRINGDTSNPGVGILKPEIKAPLAQVFPNPANKQLQVELNNQGNTVQYVLFGANGQKMLSGQETTDFSIDVEKLANGIYFLRIDELDSNRSESMRIVIHHE
ncbi:MAG: T9SS type A sorting domain-containing protein, partial [Bacteroidota bacterium]|nr:T9SS type A sorting domain-containing protein [Bacteroidota bacterium]MDX5430382.1 T9SS type A sorting domain-containing protein [Bacteroidota bacterium]MDX5469143.1 T9SS type A sorting domain-containing protein [Bacteroidota bacterium]